MKKLLTGTTAIYPESIYKALKNKFPELMNGRQQDAHELILKMLEVGPQHKSEWQNNFEGWLKQEITCKKCWNTSTSRSLAFYDLNLALSDHNNFVDALSGHFDAEDVDIFCNSCKTLERSTKTQKIIRPPRIFFIQMKRFGNGDKKDGRKMNLPTVFQFENFNYDLMATINHIGTLNSGHYWAEVLHGENFYECNDEVVKKINRKCDSDSAYLLFFQLKNPEQFWPKNQVRF